MLYLISADGSGAGKSTLANKLSRNVMSLAGLLRYELHRKHPEIDWYRKDQEYKDKVKFKGRTVREWMIEHATNVRLGDETHYVRALCEEIKKRQGSVTGFDTIAVDDLRFGNEILYFKTKFPQSELCHFHICIEGATPNLETQLLKSIADYRVSR